ncbi:MAG: helix-turn-helix domain-containing protein [Paracoccus sp. (in: a-proteobacteria)]
MPPRRRRPRDLVDDWPESPLEDVPGEIVRQIALALSAAINKRSLRTVARLTGVDHTTIADILRGTSWPDALTIARLEIGLGAHLWPTSFVAGHLGPSSAHR